MTADGKENAADLWRVRDGRPGMCPQCANRGEVLAPCENRACRTWGYRFLPEMMAKSAHHINDMETARAIGTAVGEFVLLGFVGAGQFGRVFEAVDPSGRRVALKLLHTAAGRGDEGSAPGESALKREVAALRKLSDENIVGYLADGLSDARPWLAMEFLSDCRSLESEIRARRSTPGFTVAELRRIVAGLCKGLTAAHSLGIVHRDMKPANVMMCGQGAELIPKIVDFGLAKFVGDGSRTRSLAGTPRYMAPEQLAGGKIGPWTDVYAAGCMFAELLSGERVLEGVAVDEIDRLKLQENFDPLATIRNLSGDERAFLAKAVAHDAAARIASAAALWNGLSVLLEARRPTGAQGPTAAHGDYWQGRASDLERENNRLRVALESATGTPGGSDDAATAHGRSQHAKAAASGLVISGAVLLTGIVLLVVWSYQRPVIPGGEPEAQALAAATQNPAATAAKVPTRAELPGPRDTAPAEPLPVSADTTEPSSRPGDEELDRAAKARRAPERGAPAEPALRTTDKPTRPRSTAAAERPRDLRWIARADQTVLDSASGLVWQAGGSPYSLSWADAHQYCQRLRLAGRADWRLPGKAELVSLIDVSRTKGDRIWPAFVNASFWYWSGTAASDASHAWAVDFDAGDAVQHVVQAGNRVRCVASP